MVNKTIFIGGCNGNFPSLINLIADLENTTFVYFNEVSEFSCPTCLEIIDSFLLATKSRLIVLTPPGFNISLEKLYINISFVTNNEIIALPEATYRYVNALSQNIDIKDSFVLLNLRNSMDRMASEALKYSLSSAHLVITNNLNIQQDNTICLKQYDTYGIR